MLAIRDIQRTEIRYLLITDHSEIIQPFISPNEFANDIHDFINRVPKDILQLVDGVHYYEICTKSQVDNPIRFQVIYSENLNLFLRSITQPGIIVFIINPEINRFSEVLNRLILDHNVGRFYYFLKSNVKLDKSIPNYVKSPANLLIQLVNKQDEILKYLEVNEIDLAPNVSIYDSGFFDYPNFIPAQNCFRISHSIIGNFSFEENNKLSSSELEEITEAMLKVTSTAIKSANVFHRMDMIVDQIRKTDSFSIACIKDKIVQLVNGNEPIAKPLIIILPFHNPDIKHMDIFKGLERDTIVKFTDSMDSEQTQNYITKPGPNCDVKISGAFSLRKTQYLDLVGILHSSFLFSPLLRLPSQGRSIYRNLSFFRPQVFTTICNPKNRQTIRKTIEKFGVELRKRIVSEKLKKNLINVNRQVVAITDLPIEWLNIDGIPLSFTHDVCRIPETTLHGVMSVFTLNEQYKYVIPNDILKKTLVIFGSDEPDFKHWQPLVEGESKRNGFKTKVCLSIKEFVDAFKEEQPELLIFDCHGGVDMENKSSFLVLGNEKLSGEAIIANGINPPLVFLSACGTAPTYGTINTIANAFFQNLSLSVTTTYLPIGIQTGSILYIRLLNNLAYAAEKGIHPNWLEFLGHLIRTSAISEAYRNLHKSLSDNIDPSEINKSDVSSRTRLMIFSERRKLFQELDKIIGAFHKKKTTLFSDIVPEYLFYSNLGRSDLIKFRSYVDKYQQLNEVNGQ